LGLLTEGELGDLLTSFSDSAFRFETRERYNAAVGREPLRRFLAGEPDDYEWHRSWLDKIRKDRIAGKIWQRVRIVSVPPSEYTRYGLEVARLNIEAGEDIRYLRRSIAVKLGIAPYDAWLFDSTRLVHLHFDKGDDTFCGAETIADPAVVTRHLQWRELAWRHAQTRDEFVAALR
jgi:hypothetical protein